ncbi:glycosyltransferase family 1 protein [Faecalibacterium prausnitzii]
MSEPIRVLHVFFKMDRGGAETMIMNLYRHIDRSKLQFDFIVHSKEKGAYDNEIEKFGGKIYYIPKYKGINHFEYKRLWNRFLGEHSEYKIIHGHLNSTASIYLKIAKKFGLVTIAHSHNTSAGSGIYGVLKNILQDPIKYVADYLFACSKEAGNWLFGKGVYKKNNFYLLKNAIDTEQFVFNKSIRMEKRKQLKIEDKFVVGHIGRFHAQKNHVFLIDIFKEVYARKSNAVLLLVGDGDLRSKIEDKINKLGLSNRVIFTGVRKDIPDLLQAMDVFLFPSLYEGLGVVTIEAQASGLPCIVSDAVPNEAFITELIQPISLDKSPEHWAKEILRYSEGYMRKNTSSEIKENGYDVKDTAKWLESFYLMKINID